VCFERHPRRTLRLVHQVRRIEWQLCNSPEAAIERERELLLALRPPFNRAGVWQGTPWWLPHGAARWPASVCVASRETAALDTSEISTTTSAPFMNFAEAEPFRPPEQTSAAFGPYRAEFPFVYAALMRTLCDGIGPIFHS